MQLRTYIAAIIFTASYLPLSLILLIQDLAPESLSRPFCSLRTDFAGRCDLPFQHPWIGFGLVALCVICLAVSLATLGLARPKNQIQIVSSEHVPADLMNYTLPYIVSFMSLDYKDSAKFLGFFVFYAWFFLLTYRSGQIMMNPALAVFGWRLYSVDYKFVGGSDKTYTDVALVSGELSPGGIHPQVKIQDILIIKPGKPK